MPSTHHHRHHPEKYYLTVPFAKFPRRFGTNHHPSPRHMTLVPWFRLRRGSDEANMMQDIGAYCKDQIPFTVTFGETKGYGPDESQPGQPVVGGRERVIALHCGLLAVVRSWADIIDDTWIGDRFTEPHSTLLGEQPFDTSPIGVWSVLVVGKYVKDEHRMNEPDKVLSDGFRMRGRIDR